MPSIPTKRSLPWVKVTQFKDMKVIDDFYQSPEWRRFRKVYIATHPLCVKCEAAGKIRSSKVVDHIVPINDGGDRFNESNLQALCSSCHNIKSAHDRWRKKKIK